MTQRGPRRSSWRGITVALVVMVGAVLPGARLADVQTLPAVAAPHPTARAGTLSLPATAVPAVATPGAPAGASSALQGAGATHLENFQRPSRLTPIAPSPEAQGWTTLMAEDFEGDFPGTTWTLYGDPTWDDVNYRALSGAWSGYCAAAGSGAVSPPGPYPNDMNAWMVFGPFDLSRAADAELLFFHWTKTEADYDKFWVLAWDGVNESWWGSSWSGDYVAECGGWCESGLDLTNVGDLGNLAGKPEVWIAFKFESDSSAADEGTYVDGVVLRALVEGEEPIFFDDFSDADSGWPTASSAPENYELGYAGGEYHIYVKQQNWVAWANRSEVFGDFDVRVRARGVDGPFTPPLGAEAQGARRSAPAELSHGPEDLALDPGIDGAYGLVFRYVDGDNFYYFAVSPSAGEYRLNKQVNDEWVSIQPWTWSAAINQGAATNELRAVAQGNRIRVYVNGEQLVDIVDPSFVEGRLGLAVTNFGDPAGMHGAFDDIAVYGVGTAPATPTPTATRPPSGGDISGQVTRNGAPARDGTQLELRFYDGNTWSTAATTTTAGGTYHFRDLPTLGVDQVYYVRYQNAAGADGYLWGWFCEFLLSYTAGTNVHGCDFDIADVALGSPDGPSPRPLPVTFNWAIRSNVRSDTYRFHMWDPDTIAEYVSDNLDRAGRFTLEFLPPGFGVGQPYSWDVWIVGPGGLGVSLGTHTVTLELAGPAVRESFLPLIMRNFGVPPSPVPLNNGNFESGSLQPDWLSGGQLPASIAGGHTPHGGVYAAQLGDPALGPGFPQSNLPVGSGWIEQEFTVPAAGSPRLAFWYQIYTYDKGYSPSTAEFWDTFVVTVRSDTVFRDGFCWHQGSVNETECRTWTPRLRDLGWQQGSIDLSPYRGQTVRVRFATWNDETVFRKRGDTGAGAYNTYTYVDDVQLIP